MKAGRGKSILAALLVICLAAGGWYAWTHRGPPSPGTVPGTDGTWIEDMDAAHALARTTARPIFLLFTGSDWCDFCRLMKLEVYSKPEWKDFASRRLVLVMLDFPKRHPQTAALKAQNKRLADLHHVEGYPTMVVLAPDGHELGKLTTNLILSEFLTEVARLIQ